jgi:hypothetical protein
MTGRTALLFLGSFILIAFSCTPKGRYDRELRRGLKDGQRMDSLFLGIYLGMSDKDFYMHCWELNRKGLVIQGLNNVSVEYSLRKELKHPAIMNFYPVFTDGRISEMPVRFVYSGWAPWNKDLAADALQSDVVAWFTKSFGKGFFKVRHREKGTAMVKIDKNRRISVFKTDDMYVWAVFTDMSVKKDKEIGNPPSALPDTTSTKEIK